jgi:hypothetical protein
MDAGARSSGPFRMIGSDLRPRRCSDEPDDWTDDVAVHGLAAGDLAVRHLAAVHALASSGSGHGHRRLILIAALIVIVAIVVGVIIYLRRSRRDRGGRGES